MPLRINLNANALNAQTNLGIVQRKLSTALERLSSGLRINHAWDDPSGYLVSLQMQFQIDGVDTGTDNLKMAIDLLNTADSFTKTVSEDMERMDQLAFQAKNSLLTGAQRSALGYEFSNIVDEITRLTSNATYNGQTLLTGSLVGITIQTGFSAGDVIMMSIDTLTVQQLQLTLLGISTVASAGSAIIIINSVVQNVLSPAIAGIGAQAAGWLKSTDAQEMYSTNLKSARSRIMDADIAQETTNLTNAQVIVQSGIAALSQANQAQTLALSLISAR
jgi:flagellin